VGNLKPISNPTSSPQNLEEGVLESFILPSPSSYLDLSNGGERQWQLLLGGLRAAAVEASKDVWPGGGRMTWGQCSGQRVGWWCERQRHDDNTECVRGRERAVALAVKDGRE
jgi:hypothetical protein